MPNDPNDPQQPVVANTPPVSSAATTPPAATTTAIPASASTPDSQQSQPSQAQPTQPGQQNPQQPSAAQPSTSQPGQQPGQPSPSDGTVSNTPSVHPSVARAGILRNVAQALAGGPSYRTSVDPSTGAVTRTQVPLTKSDIGMALAFEALSGALTGLGQRGPNAVGLAGAAGLAQGQQLAQQRQQAQQQQTEDAKADADSQYNALARKAQLLEINTRIATQTKSAERMDLENQQLGLQNMKSAVDTNADLLTELQQQGAISEDHVSQDALQAGIASGKYNATESIALPDSIATINGKPEQTFSIIPNTALKTNLTQEQFDTYANANVPGFPKGTKLPSGGYPVSVFTLARANSQMLGVSMAKSELSQVTDTLANSSDPAAQQLAKSIPNLDTVLSDKTNGPVLAQALGKLGKWTAYSDVHGMDLGTSLRAMLAPTKADPRNPKQTVTNPDAGAAQTIISALGGGDMQKGLQVLSAYSQLVTPEPIKNVAEAQSIATDPTSTPREVTRANAFLAKHRQEKIAVARAGAEARASVKAANDAAAAGATPGQPDALGFTPNIAAMGGTKEYNKRLNPFKKNFDQLAQTEASYQQFSGTLDDLAAGKDMSGAQSVVGLFNAIGLSAVPLAGRGFRVSENVIKEHQQARGWGQALQAKLLNAKEGDVITPQQLKDYATIAQQARQSAYVNLANELHSNGLPADAALPTGNGQKIDAPTARIFFTLSGNDPNKARAAATKKGWSF